MILLAWLWFFLPLEAFDADADVGLDEAILQGGDSLRSSHSIVPPNPHGLAGPPIWRALSSVRPGATTSLAPDLNGSVDRQAQLLRASRLCARSRIAKPPWPPQQQVRTRNLVVSSRSFTDLLAVEGGFFLRGSPRAQDQRRPLEGGAVMVSLAVEAGKEVVLPIAAAPA
jgi:hypothetical protein